MAIAAIIVSFILTLITSMIVMVGAISFLYWLSSSTATPFVIAHRQPLTYLACCGLLVFLVAQASRDSYIGSTTSAGYLPYLNLLIVTVYMFNLQQGLKWPAILDIAVIGLCYFLFGAPLSILGVAAVVVACVTLYWVQVRVRRQSWNSVRNCAGFLIFGVAVLISQLNIANADLWFWARQLVALVLLSGFCFGFDRIMRATRLRTDKLHSLSTIDELTGVHNFGTFNKELDSLFAQFQKDGKQYSVFEGDLDHFKHINDTYGHPSGNAVLRQLALELDSFAGTLPFPATAYRLGGEEFAIIAHTSLTHAQAMQIGERFLELLKLVRFPDADPNLTITCSIGQARVEPGDYSANDVYKKADRNLYAAKQSGRNCVRAQEDGATK